MLQRERRQNIEGEPEAVLNSLEQNEKWPLLEGFPPITDSFGDNFTFLPKGKDRENLAKPGETLIEFMKRGARENLYDWYVVYDPKQIACRRKCKC